MDRFNHFPSKKSKRLCLSFPSVWFRISAGRQFCISAFIPYCVRKLIRRDEQRINTAMVSPEFMFIERNCHIRYPTRYSFLIIRELPVCIPIEQPDRNPFLSSKPIEAYVLRRKFIHIGKRISTNSVLYLANSLLARK